MDKDLKLPKEDNTFLLRIELGNDAMVTPVDVADTLRLIADRLLQGESEGLIRDTNGNTVGSYRFSLEA